MFGRENNHLESGFLKGNNPLFRVKICRVKKNRIFFSFTPFTASKSVHPEVNECCQFQLLPLVLLVGWSEVGRQFYFLFGCNIFGESQFFYEVLFVFRNARGKHGENK
ncbi:hypothetical protein SDC9_90369 [bioreactor metagenome]|uniref:Uncharacterized protein n=1 Tax=bioreactor metagenome TaxID=1076179 RepID=A0A644ZS67_9ZZZZ